MSAKKAMKNKQKQPAHGGCSGGTCSACGGSGLGAAMYRPEIDRTQRDRCYTCQGTGGKPPSNSPVGRVEWQGANLHSHIKGVTVPAWILIVNGRPILHAVALSEITEPVSAEDRKMIGQALAEYLANDQVEARRP